MIKATFLSLLPFAARAVYGQAAALYTDPDNGITFLGSTDVVNSVTTGYAFPPLDGTSTDEFLGEIIAPIEVAWAGVSPAGRMLQSILLVAWPNEDEIVSSARYAETYEQPTVLEGPVVTTLASSSVNETHWKWVYRCQQCTTWEGGSLQTNTTGVPAWVVSSAPVDDPADPASTFEEHTSFGFYGADLSTAHATQEDYDAWVAA